MTSPVVVETCAGGAGLVIRMQAPRANALEPGLLAALAAALDDAAARAPGFVVLAGGRHFTSGGDVARFARAADEGRAQAHADAVVPALQDAVMRLLSLPCAVVAAARGAVTGGGAGLLFAADIGVVAPGTFVQPYYTAMGFAPDGGWTAVLPERIGAGAAQAWLMSDRREDAQGLLRLGLAQRVAEDPEAAAIDMLRDADHGALAATKALIWDAPRRAAVRARLDGETAAFAAVSPARRPAPGCRRFLPPKAPKGGSGMFDTVPDMALKRAELSGDATAFADHGSGRDWSFAAVNRAADAVAAGLAARGIAEGARIAIVCHNCAEFFVTLFACQKTGIILCPLNWRQPAPELVDTMAPVAPQLLIHDAAHAGLAADIAAATGIATIDIAGTLAGWIAQNAPPRSAPVPAARPWYLLFTSGTTGRPKAVIQTARMCWANTVNIGQAIGLTGDDSTVNFLPLFHTAGINLYTLPVFLNGGRSTIVPRFEAETLLTLLRAGAVTQFFGVPAIYQAFSLSDMVDAVDWRAIRCGCGGAPLPAPLIRFFADRGAMVLNGFGMTETGPTVFLMDPARAADKIGSVGRAQMLTEMRLAGVAAGATGTGEVQLRGPGLTPGYFDNPQATADTFTDDGWLKTGDVGRRDGDGYVYIVDRIKDMYISGGENVYPAEVERVLDDHADVLEAAVVGVDDAKWGEVGVACVIARPGARIDPQALRDWCRERLAAYKVPARVVTVDDFPRTAAGKVRKPALRETLQ